MLFVRTNRNFDLFTMSHISKLVQDLSFVLEKFEFGNKQTLLKTDFRSKSLLLYLGIMPDRIINFMLAQEFSIINNLFPVMF